MKPKDVWALFKDAGVGFIDHYPSRHGAALAYYSVFAIAPLFLLAVAVGGIVYGEEAARGQLLSHVDGLFGAEGGAALEAMLSSARREGTGGLAAFAGVVMLLFGASGLFGQLQDSLNAVWEVGPKPGRGVWGIIRDRFLSFTMVLGTIFLLMVTLVISTALAILGKMIGAEDWYLLSQVVDFLLSFSVITFLFAVIFRYLPDARIAWRDVWVGAASTSLLFGVGKVLLGLYLGRSAIASSYGAAGSIAVLLVWSFYTAQIFLFGAELTKAYARRYGSGVVPEGDAVVMLPERPAEEGDPNSSGEPGPMSKVHADSAED